MGYKRLCKEYWYKEKKHAEFSILCSFPAVGKFLITENDPIEKQLAFFWKMNSLLREFGHFSWQIWVLFQSKKQCNNVFLLFSKKIYLYNMCSCRSYNPFTPGIFVSSLALGSLHCLAGRLQLLFCNTEGTYQYFYSWNENP